MFISRKRAGFFMENASRTANRFKLFREGVYCQGGTMQEYAVVIEKDEDGYFVASVPAIPGCHTQAKTLGRLMERIREAIKLCLESDVKLPKHRFVGVRSVRVNGYGRAAPAQA